MYFSPVSVPHNGLFTPHPWKFPPHLVCLPWPSERPHSHHWVTKSVLHMTSTLQQPSTSSRLALPNHTSIFPCLESHAGVRHAMRPLSGAVGITNICNLFHFPMVGCPGAVTKSFQVAEPTGQCIGPSPVLSVCVHFFYIISPQNSKRNRNNRNNIFCCTFQHILLVLSPKHWHFFFFSISLFLQTYNKQCLFLFKA